MNAFFIITSAIALLGLSLGIFGYVRFLRLHKLVALENRHIDTDDLDNIYIVSMIAGSLLFILCSIVSIGTWQTSEYKYQYCMNKTKDTAYCSRYLKD